MLGRAGLIIQPLKDVPAVAAWPGKIQMTIMIFRIFSAWDTRAGRVRGVEPSKASTSSALFGRLCNIKGIFSAGTAILFKVRGMKYLKLLMSVITRQTISGEASITPVISALTREVPGSSLVVTTISPAAKSALQIIRGAGAECQAREKDHPRKPQENRGSQTPFH